MSLPLIAIMATAQWNTSLPLSDAWSGYLAEAQAQITTLNTRAVLLLLVNIPVLAIAVNVLRQLVSGLTRRRTKANQT